MRHMRQPPPRPTLNSPPLGASWLEDCRTWAAPDIYVPPTFEAYRRNEDPALDVILAIREDVPG